MRSLHLFLMMKVLKKLKSRLITNEGLIMPFGKRIL